MNDSSILRFFGSGINFTRVHKSFHGIIVLKSSGAYVYEKPFFPDKQLYHFGFRSLTKEKAFSRAR